MYSRGISSSLALVFAQIRSPNNRSPIGWAHPSSAQRRREFGPRAAELNQCWAFPPGWDCSTLTSVSVLCTYWRVCTTDLVQKHGSCIPALTKWDLCHWTKAPWFLRASQWLSCYLWYLYHYCKTPSSIWDHFSTKLLNLYVSSQQPHKSCVRIES